MSKMPLAFVGHGSPMNAIEDNTYSRGWRTMAGMMPKPKAILMVSAHWFVRGTRILDDPAPKTTYDMYGFPEELYRVVYDAAGAPDIAHQAADLLHMGQVETRIDNSWGFDHGAWSVLNHMYPHRDVPVFQISVDNSAPGAVHFMIGQLLAPLREAGVLIIGSGNIVHNLRLVDWSKSDEGFDWADAFDQRIHDLIVGHSFEPVVQAGSASQAASAKSAASAGSASSAALTSKEAQLSIPTPDHFFPLLYVLGACDSRDTVHVFNDARVYGSISMTSYLFSAD